jgi:hypothetical protein
MKAALRLPATPTPTSAPTPTPTTVDDTKPFTLAFTSPLLAGAAEVASSFYDVICDIFMIWFFYTAIIDFGWLSVIFWTGVFALLLLFVPVPRQMYDYTEYRRHTVTFFLLLHSAGSLVFFNVALFIIFGIYFGCNPTCFAVYLVCWLVKSPRQVGTNTVAFARKFVADLGNALPDAAAAASRGAGNNAATNHGNADDNDDKLPAFEDIADWDEAALKRSCEANVISFIPDEKNLVEKLKRRLDYAQRNGLAIPLSDVHIESPGWEQRLDQCIAEAESAASSQASIGAAASYDTDAVAMQSTSSSSSSASDETTTAHTSIGTATAAAAAATAAAAASAGKERPMRT